MAREHEALIAAVEPVVAALGLDLYDVELLGSGPARILRVTIDREGGVDLEAITKASEALSPALDAAPASSGIRGPYTLEVTSPGLERALRTPEHFRRALGATVSVKTGSGGGASRRRGVLASVDDDGFELDIDDGTRARVGYAEVAQARTVFEWGGDDRAPRRATKQRAKKQKVRS